MKFRVQCKHKIKGVQTVLCGSGSHPKYSNKSEGAGKKEWVNPSDKWYLCSGEAVSHQAAHTKQALCSSDLKSQASQWCEMESYIHIRSFVFFVVGVCSLSLFYCRLSCSLSGCCWTHCLHEILYGTKYYTEACIGIMIITVYHHFICFIIHLWTSSNHRSTSVHLFVSLSSF